jgi:hypothetical protein
VRTTTRLLLACLTAPAGVPLAVLPVCAVEAWLGALTREEAVTQALVWSAFGMPAALMALITFWAPLHMWLHGYAVRSVWSHLGLAATIAAALVYVAVVALPGVLDELESWHWAAYLLSTLNVGIIAWAVATGGGRR